MPDAAPGVVAPRDWGQERVFIVGGGASLVSYRDGLRQLHEHGIVLAINSSWRDCTADVVFSVDHLWAKKNTDVIPRIPAPVTVALDRDHPRPVIANLTYVFRRPREEPPQLSKNSGEVTNLLNSGASGVDYAALRGAIDIYLLGFDFKPGPIGRSHYHEGYEWHSAPNSGRMYPRWAKLLDALAPALKRQGIAVTNCSPTTLLTAYPYRPYTDFL